jgi:integrase
VKKPPFPKVIRQGHTRATIYKTPYRGSDGYTVVWYEGEVRKRKLFADLGDAELHAQARVGQLSRGTAEVLRLEGAELLAYVRAREAVAEFGLALDTIAFEYRDAKRLVRRRSLVDVADYFARQNLLELPSKTVADVYSEMLKAKKAEGCSERYVQDLESRVSKFVLTFGNRQVSGVNGTEIKDWLQGLQHSTSRVDPKAPKVPVTNRTRNNFRLCIQTLFSFAKSQRYLPADWSEMESVPVWKVKEEEVEVFTPDEMTLLLALAPANLVPFLSIGAFAGLRSAEIDRLDWSKVDLESGYITVDASIAKTNSRRLVPISENLRAWLMECRKPRGKVLELANVVNALKRLATAARETETLKAETLKAETLNAEIGEQKAHDGQDGALGEHALPLFEWKHNALRHSFCSYRLAEVKSAAQVALEAGNSPQMIFQHYRELVTEKSAKAWFGITPETAKAVREQIEKERAAKIVRFPAVAAA